MATAGESRPRRHARGDMPRHVFSSLLLVLAVAAVVPVFSVEDSHVNSQVKIKREAKAAAKKRFLAKEGIVYDSYGRVLRWGKEPTRYECKESAKLGLFCQVAESKTRKYRTKEEQHRGNMIRLDKQVELDSQYGSGSEDAKRARRMRKEARRRCGLYEEWLKQYKEKGDDKRSFFHWLSGNFEDFASLRAVKPGRRGQRKSRKLYRNIAREIHHDKLPENCRGSEIKEMMSTILGQVEKIRDCIAEPHTCSEDEL